MAENIDWLLQRLAGAGAAVLIDGGMGTQLQRRGVVMDDRVWSARAMLSHAPLVQQVHESYIEAGAEVILTNTFSSGRHMLEPGRLGSQVDAINRDAVRLARQARERVATHPVAVAGSICEWIHFDQPRWQDPAALGDSVAEQAGLLAAAGVDLIALEMCQRIEYSLAAINAIRHTGLPFWIGVSARQHRGRPGLSVFDHAERDFAELVECIADTPAILISVMHSPVQDIDAALDVVDRYWNGPVGVYPESGYFAMPDWQFVDIIAPSDLAARTRTWLTRGVRLIGGCCGIGPEHIGVLSAEPDVGPSSSSG